MAAGAREYVAIFSIGAKLLGSFKSAMAGAQSRLRRLQMSVRGVAKSISIMAAGLAGLAIGAGIAAGGLILRKVLTGAEEAYKEQLTINTQLQSVLQANANIQKLGPKAAQQNMEFLGKQAEELQKIGVVSDEVLLAGAKQLAVFGMGPKEISQMLPVMGDVLATQKGVNAQAGDANKLALGLGKAIQSGALLGTKKLGLAMGNITAKEFKALTMDQRRVKVLAALEARYKGASEALGKTDVGKLIRAEHAFGELQERVGKIKLDFKVAGAEFLIKLLPRLEPVVDRIGAALGRLFGGVNKEGAKFADIVSDKIVGALETFAGWIEWMADNKDSLIPLATNIGKVTVAVIALSVAASLNPLTWVIIAAGAVAVLATNWDAVTAAVTPALEAMAQQPPTPDPSWHNFLITLSQSLLDLQANLKPVDDFFLRLRDTVASSIGELVTNMAKMDSVVTPALQAVGRAIADFLTFPIRQATEAWQTLMGWFGRKPPTIQAPTIQAPVLPSPALNVPTNEAVVPHQFGGIFSRAHMGLIGERGPEAVIPLSGGRRAEGLLNYAARAMGAGPMGGGGGTTVSFAPNITINGNATETEQRAMDSRLRDLASDFIAKFKAAQAQERRLSYESGYG